MELKGGCDIKYAAACSSETNRPTVKCRDSNSRHFRMCYCDLGGSLPVAIADHVCQHSVRARHSRAQLPVPNHARVDVVPAAIISNEQPALQRRFTGIV